MYNETKIQPNFTHITMKLFMGFHVVSVLLLSILLLPSPYVASRNVKGNHGYLIWLITSLFVRELIYIA